MATAALTGSSHLGVTDNQKRWLVAGIALNKILIPQIRPFVQQGINTEYNKLKTSHNIHGQSSSGRLQRWPARRLLKYENINGNDVHPRLPNGQLNYSLFDCRVTSDVDFARLYVENYMAKFTAFDDHCDASAVLSLLGGIPVFSASIQIAAGDVRKARNDWAHCVFSKWDPAKFHQSFIEMDQLVRNMTLPHSDERKLLGELNDWETRGTQLCMNSPVDPALLQLVKQEVKSLQDSVDNMSLEFQAEKVKVNHELGNTAISLEEVNQGLHRLERGQQTLECRADLADGRMDEFEATLKMLETDEGSSKDTVKEAHAPFASSKETTNYARLCRLLVGVGTQALRDTFDAIHPPATLPKILSAHPALQSLRKRRILNPTQWGKLYPTHPSSVSSASFDITLLVVLLRSICGFTPPAGTGSWDKLPPPGDNSPEANIARINYYRNEVYAQASQASVDDATFNFLWHDISHALLGLGSGTTYARAISRLKTECLDPDVEEHYQELLKQREKDVANTKKTLKKFKEMLTTWMREEGDIEDLLGEMDATLKMLETDEGSSKDTVKEAHAPFASSKETTNYARLCRLLVGVGTQALRDTFDAIHPPATLPKILSAHPALQSLRKRRILNPTQWGKLYPTHPSSVSSASFDITLLMVLLKNICGLTPPASTGSWDKLPLPGDNSPEANIARINFYRNHVYAHASQASVDDATFNVLWQDISNVLLALGSGTTYASRLKTECMDPDVEEHYRELLKQWEKDDANTKKTLKELKEMLATWKREKGDKKDQLGEMDDILKRLETYEGSSKDALRQTHVLPEEINLRGPLALEAYNKALNEGKTRVRRIPVMLIGQHRSGKTSLKKSLRGIRFNPDEISTVGIDVDPSYFKVTTEIWKTGETDQEANTKDASSYEQHTARLVVKKLREGELIPEESSVESVQSEDSSLVDMVTSNANKRSEGTLVSSLEFIKTGHDEFPLDKQLDVSASPRASRVSDFDDGSNVYNTLTTSQKIDPTNRGNNHVTTSKIPDEIETLMKKLLQEVDKVRDEEDIYSVLWDFGGQSVYYTTHPLFLTSRALYLMVYDLSRGLHKTAPPVTKQGMYKTIQDSFETKTNLDYLDFWMTSVASLASRDSVHTKESDLLPEKLPPVFLVCTNADRPYGGADCLALAREVYGSLQGKSYRNHLCDGFFVVDNTKSGGESECSEVARLRRSILAVANELPSMKEDIPIKWLKFEKMLQVTLGEGHTWIYLEHAKRIAAEVCQIHDNQEFVTLLNFLHDQRILIHFDDTPELNKLVVLDPQWLIDVFKKVITVQVSDGHGKAEITQLWHKLETKGILEQKLLKHVWDPLIERHETYESFIAVMEKFSLLCSWPSLDTSCNKQYLVPSMLMLLPPQNITELIASAKLPSLFLRFEPGQVPSSLFPRLVLQFFQWGQKKFWSSLDPELYKNFARFYTIGDEDCSVVLLCHSSFIEIVVHRGNANPTLVEGIQSKLTISSGLHHDPFEVSCAFAVYRQLSLMLECMRNEFCWLKNMIYEAGFICPVCCHGKLVKFCRTHGKQYCEQEDCLHFLSESEIRSTNQFIRCTRAAAALDNKVHVKNFSAWFTSPSKQTATDEMNGRQFLSGERSEEVSHAQLPGDVIESLMSDSCHPKEIVLKMKESLHLDQMCLQQPNLETKRMIRCLAKRAKDSNRIGVVKHLREITPAGTTGPLLPGNLDIRNIPVCQMRELTIYLSGGEEWKDVAAKLGLSPIEIRYLDKRIPNPCDAALAFISQRCHINVDDLYDVLTECGYPVPADIL